MENDKIRDLIVVTKSQTIKMEIQKFKDIEKQLNLVYTEIETRKLLSAKIKLRWIIDAIREEIEVERQLELLN